MKKKIEVRIHRMIYTICSVLRIIMYDGEIIERYVSEGSARGEYNKIRSEKKLL